MVVFALSATSGKSIVECRLLLQLQLVEWGQSNLRSRVHPNNGSFDDDPFMAMVQMLDDADNDAKPGQGSSSYCIHHLLMIRLT